MGITPCRAPAVNEQCGRAAPARQALLGFRHFHQIHDAQTRRYGMAQDRARNGFEKPGRAQASQLDRAITTQAHVEKADPAGRGIAYGVVQDVDVGVDISAGRTNGDRCMMAFSK